MNRWDAGEAISLEKRWGYRLTMGKGLSAPQLRLRHIRLENSHCENRDCFFLPEKIHYYVIYTRIKVARIVELNILWANKTPLL